MNWNAKIAFARYFSRFLYAAERVYAYCMKSQARISSNKERETKNTKKNISTNYTEWE